MLYRIVHKSNGVLWYLGPVGYTHKEGESGKYDDLDLAESLARYHALPYGIAGVQEIPGGYRVESLGLYIWGGESGPTTLADWFAAVFPTEAEARQAGRRVFKDLPFNVHAWGL